MKKKMFFPLLSAVLVLAPAAKAAPTLEQRVEELELSRDMNIFKWSGKFMMKHENIARTKDAKTLTFNATRMQYHLDMDANVSDKIKFYSRFSMTKWLNHYNRDLTKSSSLTSNQSATAGTGPEANEFRDLIAGDETGYGPAVVVEKAFFNWSVTDGFALSIGRLPTLDGNPVNMYSDTSKEGGYPHLAYSYTLDGIAGAYNFKNWMPAGHSFTTRVIWTPLQTIGDTTYSRVYTGTNANGGFTLKHTNIYTAMGEYSWRPNNGLFADFTFIPQFTMMKDNQFGNYSTDSLFTDATRPPSIDYNIQTAYAQFVDIMGMGLDLALAYSQTSVTTHGGICVSVAAGHCAQFRNIFHTYQTTSPGTTLPYPEKETKGNGYVATLKYKLPIVMLKRPSLGVEAQKGSHGWFRPDGARLDEIDFYSTRGHGYHVFWVQPITSELKMTVGWKKKVDTWGSGLTSMVGYSVARENVKFENLYANLRLEF